MNTLPAVQAVLASYLAATLGATALAKLKNRQTAVVGMLREGVVPARGVPAVLGAVAGTELVLATLLAFGVRRAAVAVATAALFAVFAGYRLAVAVRTKSLMCSCAGAIRNDPASPPVVVGAVLACLIQAVCAGVLAVGRQPPGYPADLLTVAAWTVPVIGLLLGGRRRSAAPGTRYPDEFFQLGTAELPRASVPGQQAG